MNIETQSVNVCRVCLQPDNNTFRSLFEQYNNHFIYEFINSIITFSIFQGDGLPDKICSFCLLDLETCINFKSKCESSNDLLCKNTFKSELDIISVNEKKIDISENETDANCMEDYESLTDCLDSTQRDSKLVKENSVTGEIVAFNNELPQCHECGDIFKTKYKLKVHWKHTHLPKTFLCPICKRVFKTSYAYNKHRKRESGPCSELANGIEIGVEGEGNSRIFYCKHCDYKSSIMLSIRNHITTHSRERLYKCNICNKAYTRSDSLTTHCQTVHFKEKYVKECHICGKTYNGLRRLNKHLRTHSNSNFQCDICKRIIKNKQSLVTHMLRHSGSKSYTCEQCAASFYTLSELCNHRRFQHIMKAVSVKCDFCSYEGPKHKMNIHMKHHSSLNKPHSCQKCGKFFATVRKLTYHESIHYDTKKYSCPLCSQLFFRRSSIRKHLSIKHNTSMSMLRYGGTQKKELLSTIKGNLNICDK